MAKLTAGRRTPDEVLRVLVVGTTSLLLLVAAVIVWRRLAGALSTPLAPQVMLLVAVATGGLATAARAFRRRSVRGDRVFAVTISAAVLVLGLAVSVPRTTAVAIVLLWAVLVAEEFWAWKSVLRRRSGIGGVGRDSATPPDKPQTAPAAAPNCALPATIGPEQDVTQQLTRVESADGRDILRGWLRVPLLAGQRIGNVHVAFCPPFAHAPKTVVEQVDGPKARVKTVQVLPFGVRFEVKLSGAAEESTRVVLQFDAELPAVLPEGQREPASST